MLFFPLPKETLRLWRWRVGFGTLSAGAVFLFFSAVFLWLLIPFFLLFFFAGFLWIWYLPQYANRYAVSLKKDEIEVQSGIFFRRIARFPFSGLIFVQTRSSPLARHMKLCSVAARFVRGKITIPELKEKKAELFAKTVMERMKNDD